MRSFVLACALLLVAVTTAFPAGTPASPAGDWEGKLDAFNLRIVMHLVQAAGKWTAVMDSPDQGGYGIPCDEVKVNGSKVYIALDAVEMEFEGTLSKDGNAIEGIFTQGGARLPLTLARTGGAPTAPAVPTPVNAQQPLAGDWLGILDIGQKLRIAIHLVNKDGVWSGSTESLDQDATSMPFSKMTVDGMKLHWEVATIGSSYDGTLDSNANIIKGTLSQGTNSAPLDFGRANIPGPNRPQEPKPPFPYRSEDVTVPGPSGIALAGTLTMPNGNGPFSAVVLATGSGPSDRDESIDGHKPFLVLSDYLTRQGIAVLRLDDRGVGKSTGDFATATTETFAQDALAEVAYLKTRKEIDPKRIGLAGHSEGGLIAPIAASRATDVAFVVMMAGPAVRAGELLSRQIHALAIANGASEAVAQPFGDAVRRMCQIAARTSDATLMRNQINAVTDSLTTRLSGPAAGPNNMIKQQAQSLQELVMQPWFLYWLTLKPEEILRQVKQPVLAINGSLDLQVSAKENLPVIEKALRDGGNKDVTIVELPGLNHLFQTAKTGSPMEYGKIEETMSPVALKTISDWIVARTTAKTK